jgi:hypothetical protein
MLLLPFCFSSSFCDIFRDVDCTAVWSPSSFVPLFLPMFLSFFRRNVLCPSKAQPFLMLAALAVLDDILF